MRHSTAESRIPTETFLLPGQQFCVGLPWERASLPKHGVPVSKPKAAPAPGGTTLDQDSALAGDPCAGWELGACEIIRRLSPGSARRLLAIRRDRLQEAVVDLCRIELPDVLGPEIQTHASWASKFLHPHLARVFPAEVSEEGIFWVTERVSGATLSELAEAGREVGKALPLGLLLSSIHEAALGLGALHDEGQAHGLVGAQAVAVGFDGQARVLDLGLFRCLARRSTWTQVLELMGPYLAPEQVLQGRLPDPKCDVFSLAMVLYEGLTGSSHRKAGFEERVKQAERGTLPPPSSLNVVLTRSLDEVVMKALSSDRAARFPNATAFAHALKQVGAPFMWRPKARAEFVESLFGTRKRQEQGLTAQIAPRRRSSVQLRVVRPEELEVDVVEAPMEAPVQAPPPLPARSPARPRVVPNLGLKPLAPPPPRRRPVAWQAPALTALVAAVLGLGLANVDARALATSAALALHPLGAKVQPVVVLQAAAAPVEASPALEVVASADPVRGPAASVAVTWALGPVLEAPRAVTPGKPAARAKVRKPKRDEAPLPPWLSARGRR